MVAWLDSVSKVVVFQHGSGRENGSPDPVEIVEILDLPPGKKQPCLRHG